MYHISVQLPVLILNAMDTFQSPANKPILTINRPVHMEAFELQKNGMLLLPRIHTCAMRLHADESMFDKRLPHVVQLSSIDPVKNTTLAVTQRTSGLQLVTQSSNNTMLT